MKLLSIGHSNGHRFLIYADSPAALKKSLQKHGPALAEQLFEGETVVDKFLRMKQLAVIIDIAKAYEK